MPTDEKWAEKQEQRDAEFNIKYEKWAEKLDEEAAERTRAFEQGERAEHKHQNELFRKMVADTKSRKASSAAQKLHEFDITRTWTEKTAIELRARIDAFEEEEHAAKLRRLEQLDRMMTDQFVDKKEGVQYDEYLKTDQARLEHLKTEYDEFRKKAGVVISSSSSN